MSNLDGWDWAILAVAGYVAVSSLVRLMRSHHDRVVGQLREQIEQEAVRQQKHRRKTRSTERTTTAADEGQRTDAA